MYIVTTDEKQVQINASRWCDTIEHLPAPVTAVSRRSGHLCDDGALQ